MFRWVPLTEILENSMGLKDCNNITRWDGSLQKRRGESAQSCFDKSTKIVELSKSDA
jgi:hypothetical protein